MVQLTPSQGSQAPLDYQHYVDCAKAAEKEGQGNSAARGRPLSVKLPVDGLKKLEEILRTYPSDSLLDTTDYFFLLDRKNTKLEFGENGTIADTIENYWATVKVQRQEMGSPGAKGQFLDLGAQWSPNANNNLAFARHCCLRNTLRFLYGDYEIAISGCTDEAMEADFDKKVMEDGISHLVKRGAHYQYPLHQLYDTACITSTPAKNSSLYQAGVRYFQTYATVKAVLAYGGTYPFTKTNLVFLGYDKETRDSLATRYAKTGTREADLTSNKASRVRTWHALDIAKDRNTQYPWRCEIRADGDFLRRLEEAEKSWNTRLAQPTEPLPIPEYGFFLLERNVYFRFLKDTINQYSFAMDLIRATTYNTPVQYGTAALYATLQLCLRNFVCPLKPTAQPYLLNPIRRTESPRGKILPRGLQFQETMRNFGFGFIHPATADWDLLVLENNFSADFQIPEFSFTKPLKSLVTAHGTADHWLDGILRLMQLRANELRGDRMRSDPIIPWSAMTTLVGILEPDWVTAALALLLGHQIFLQWRKYMCLKLFANNLGTKGSTNPGARELRQMIEDDKIVFSFEGFRSLHSCGLTSKDFSFLGIHSNRSAQLPHQPERLLGWWLGEQSQLTPSTKNIVQAEFYQTYRRVTATIERLKLPWLNAISFRRQLSKQFWENHTIAPWPNKGTGGVASNNKGKQRIMIAFTRDAWGDEVTWDRRAQISWAANPGDRSQDGPRRNPVIPGLHGLKPYLEQIQNHPDRQASLRHPYSN